MTLSLAFAVAVGYGMLITLVALITTAAAAPVPTPTDLSSCYAASSADFSDFKGGLPFLICALEPCGDELIC